MTAGGRPRIGLVLVGAGDLTGGGGAERYFADLFLAWRAREAALRSELWLITDTPTRRRLAEVGRDVGVDHVVELRGGTWPQRFQQALELYRLATGGRFDLLHLTLPLPRHHPWLWAGARRARRARIAVNINDYEVATALDAGRRPHGLDLAWRSYLAYFRSRAVDAFMVWYRRLVPSLQRIRPDRPALIHAANYCFVDTRTFGPAPRKHNEVVWAGRFVPVKRPALFIDAVARACAKAPELVDAWRFRLLGKGPLEEELRHRVAASGLRARVEIGFASRMDAMLASSRVFVSTQDEENFTSLAMLEAMACGNAIIARDVGQTRAFVREGANGLLIEAADADALADALLALMADDERLRASGVESRRITLEEHCADHVTEEFDTFWRRLAGDLA